MSLVLGIDTGGTYTDGVILDPASKTVLAKAKTFTTSGDLTLGIRKCIGSLSAEYYGRIRLVCLSTTLATNAVVEERGCTTALLLTGKMPDAAPKTEYLKLLKGFCDIKGRIIEDIDKDEVLFAAREIERLGLDAVAVSGYASVRNPTHEILIKDIIRKTLDIPVVCAHELKPLLGFTERTATALLNARLIPVIGGLIKAAKTALRKKGIEARLMMVKGDGGLMRDDYALERPVDTILSGPAASVLGGLYLTEMKDALIVDMGGTTTDIAVVRNGAARIWRMGARIGERRTHVTAADISTLGIGGDSYIRYFKTAGLSIGPRRVKPLCVAGKFYPYLLDELKSFRKKEEYELFAEQEPDCFFFERMIDGNQVSDGEKRICGLLEDGPHSLFFLVDRTGRDAESLSLSRLVDRGILGRISLTPTDILHASGRYEAWNREIAEEGLLLLAGKMGKPAKEVIDIVTGFIIRKIAAACLQSAAGFENRDVDFEKNKAALYLLEKAMGGEASGMLAVNFTLNTRIVALGAPAHAWLPAVAATLGTEAVVPEHAEVANAVGAAAGRVMETVEVLIRPGKDHEGFVMHAPWECARFEILEEALAYAIPAARRYAENLVRKMGGGTFQILETRDDCYTEGTAGGGKSYVETRLLVEAIGIPQGEALS